MYLARTDIEGKISGGQAASSQAGKNAMDDEEPLRDVLWLFTAVVFFYFAIASVEGVFQSYIYTVALCSRLNFSVSVLFYRVR